MSGLGMQISKIFFWSVDHEKLLALINQQIADGRVLRLINSF